MEDEQKRNKDETRIKEEEEAARIASADTQLLSETAVSLEVEESLELDQDNSGRDPSFNEGHFMSHNLLTSASTPICPSSAMKRLLHLSNESSEDNRTPPKKPRTELEKPAVVEPIQDGGQLAGSAQSQDSWKSHNDERHHPPDAHLKGGSFSLDNGTGDAAHLRNGSFSLDNGAAPTSYDSHQGHIYRAGISSDRLLEMRRSPTKEQLVHMIENLNKKIAKYENEREEITCPPHKNELENAEMCTKKLMCAVNAVCLVEIKNENSAYIRCISLCEEPHLMPANIFEQHGSSFGPHSSDADRSSSLTTGSIVSGPGPFEVPLTHLARLQQHHDSLTPSSTSSGGRPQHHQATANRHRLAHVKLTQGKLATPHQLRLMCPRCEYTYGSSAANQSRASSNEASPLAGAQNSFGDQEKATLIDKSLIRDVSNLTTPPTAIKISVLDDESSTVSNQMSSKRSWRQLKRQTVRRQSLKNLQDQDSLNSPEIGRHIGTGTDTPIIIDCRDKADATLRQSQQLINQPNDSLKTTELSASTLILTAEQNLEPENETESQPTNEQSAVLQISNSPDLLQSPPTLPIRERPDNEATTSWGDKGIGSSYLRLDTSSMSTDSDAEVSCFPPILDDPAITSQFLDVETSCLSRLEMCDQVNNDDDDDDDDEDDGWRGGGGGGKCPLDMADKNKSKATMTAMRSFRAQEELIEKGPIPAAGSRLFDGCAVLFSQCRSHIDVWRTLRSSSESENDRDLRSSAPDACAMDVQRLTRQVLAGGGQVYRRLHEVPRDMRDDLYLISDRPSRSPLYLACIMEGVPLISYKAVTDACRDNLNFKQLVSQDMTWFLLPVGWSDETGHSINREPQKRQPLLDKHVLYACAASAANQVTHQFWREILARMGAHVVSTEQPPTKVDITVSDGNVATPPVVNCNWIVHTLMHGTWRRYDASPFYSVEYKDCNNSTSSMNE